VAQATNQRQIYKREDPVRYKYGPGSLALTCLFFHFQLFRTIYQKIAFQNESLKICERRERYSFSNSVAGCQKRLKPMQYTSKNANTNKQNTYIYKLG